MLSPEAQARQQIDRLLEQAGWHVCNADQTNIHAAQGVAIRDQLAGLPIGPRAVRPKGRGARMRRDQFPLPGHNYADYLSYMDGKAAGVIEAKKEGVMLSGVDTQAEKCNKGLPSGLPRWANPLPFAYQSTGVVTRFTNGLDLQPRAQCVRVPSPRTIGQMVERHERPCAKHRAEPPAPPYARFNTVLSRLATMPELNKQGLWPAQIKAGRSLENSLRENRPRALIQMATGSGNAAPASPGARGIGTSLSTTFTAISFIYRLIKFGGLFKRSKPRDYNSSIGIADFDIIVTDECDLHSWTNVAGGATAWMQQVDQRMAELPRMLLRATTIDMIATGTDIRLLECVMFMRDVTGAQFRKSLMKPEGVLKGKSQSYYEQMKGRGTRIISRDELHTNLSGTNLVAPQCAPKGRAPGMARDRVTPDARGKSRFVLVDVSRKFNFKGQGLKRCA